MNRIRNLYGCPVELSLDVLGGKWKSVILARLKDSPLSYGELRRVIPDLSDKVLTERLRELQEQGLIERHASAPDKWERYGLSRRGQSLRPVLEALFAWGKASAGDLGVRFR